MPDKSAIIFLKKHHPFKLLDDRALAGLVRRLTMELYPSGAHILVQGDNPSGALYIIKEGSVAISARNGPDQEKVIDFRGAGDTFGFLSLGEGMRLDVSVQAVTATICYVADKTCVTMLLDEHPVLREYLMPSYFQKYEDRRALLPPALNFFHEGSDRIIFTTPVRDLAVRDVVTARTDASLLDAAGLMAAHRAGALVIVDGDGGPVGIVTNTDLRDKAMACRKDPSSPVADIMSAPLFTIDGGDFCFEAVLKLVSHNVHHLVVMDAGRLSGIISSRDFLVLQITSPLMIVREIEKQSSVEGLAAASGKIQRLISLLLGEGARAESIIRIITDVNDRIERKILDFAVKTLGPPPLPFCWIVYGSAGRKEQTFKTDQDNAIIFADPRSGEEAQQAEEYFGRFAEFAVNAFLRCGFALCPGDFMATNRQWRQPLSAWKRYFNSWLQTPTDKAIHNAANFFDFRGLYGDLHLAADLKKHLMEMLAEKKMFLLAMARLITDYRPPLGILGSFIVEKSGEHTNQLDLKKGCLTPVINIIRLSAFECNIPETCSFERLAVLKTVHPTISTVGDDLADALEFISLLRMRCQSEQVSMGTIPDNFINPKKLSSFEQKNLKEICKLLSRLLDDIAAKYELVTNL
jgi:CBS domain-containing protein